MTIWGELKLLCQKVVDFFRRLIALEEVHTFSIIWTCGIGLLRSEMRIVPMCWNYSRVHPWVTSNVIETHKWSRTIPLPNWSRLFVSLRLKRGIFELVNCRLILPPLKVFRKERRGKKRIFVLVKRGCAWVNRGGWPPCWKRLMGCIAP